MSDRIQTLGIWSVTNTAIVYDSEAIEAFGGVKIAGPITPCCGASGKGSIDSPTGVVCRACYEVVDSDYGMGWVEGTPGWDIMLGQLVKEGS